MGSLLLVALDRAHEEKAGLYSSIRRRALLPTGVSLSV